MSTPTGQISAKDIETTLNEGLSTNYPSATAPLTFNDSLVRTLASKPSGSISLNDMRGKAGPKPYGTVISSGCSGSTLTTVIADGMYGTTLVTTPNSSLCEAMPKTIVGYSMVVSGFNPWYAEVWDTSFNGTSLGEITGLAGLYGGISLGGGTATCASRPGANETIYMINNNGVTPFRLLGLKITATGSSVITIISTPSQFSVNSLGMVYGPAGYLISGGTSSSKFCLVSSDGVSWSQYTGAPGIFISLTASSNKYFGIVFNTNAWPQNVYTSTNGQSWTVASSVTLGSTTFDTAGVAMAYGAGRLVVVGVTFSTSSVQVGVSSDDGVTFTITAISGISKPNNVTVVYCGNSTFVVAVSTSTTGYPVWVFRSTDKGVTWSTPNSSMLPGGYLSTPPPVLYSDTNGTVVWPIGRKISKDYGASFSSITFNPSIVPPFNQQASSFLLFPRYG